MMKRVNSCSTQEAGAARADVQLGRSELRLERADGLLRRLGARRGGGLRRAHRAGLPPGLAGGRPGARLRNV